MVCHHPAKFGGNMHCGSRDILMCHLTSRDHVTKSPTQSQHPAKFNGHTGPILNLISVRLLGAAHRNTSKNTSF